MVNFNATTTPVPDNRVKTLGAECGNFPWNYRSPLNKTVENNTYFLNKKVFRTIAWAPGGLTRWVRVRLVCGFI